MKTNGIVKRKKGFIVKALRDLELQKGGRITPYDLVNSARDENSPLHHSFEWDDKRGGERYRLIQARIMLTTVKVQFMGEERELYHNATVLVDSVPIRAYFPIEQVMTDKQLHNQVLRQAVIDIEYAQKKYNSLKEFKGVINTKKLKAIKEKIAN